MEHETANTAREMGEELTKDEMTETSNESEQRGEKQNKVKETGEITTEIK